MAERLARDLAERGLVIVKRPRARDRRLRAQRSAQLRDRKHHRSARLRDRRDLPEGEQENLRRNRDSAARSSASSRWALSRAAEFPDPQPNHRRNGAGGCGGGGSAVFWVLITARLAMEFGREVYGVPGNVTQPSSFGPNQLIKQGAKLVTGWEDVVEELPTAGPGGTDARRSALRQRSERR